MDIDNLTEKLGGNLPTSVPSGKVGWAIAGVYALSVLYGVYKDYKKEKENKKEKEVETVKKDKVLDSLLDGLKAK